MFSQRIDWLFYRGDSNLLYLYTFPNCHYWFSNYIFIYLMNFKTVQLQCFNNSYWTWWLTYGVIALLLITLFYVFIPQSFLAFGPYIKVSNWTFIIIAIIIIPISFYVNHHFYNKEANTRI